MEDNKTYIKTIKDLLFHPKNKVEDVIADILSDEIGSIYIKFNYNGLRVGTLVEECILKGIQDHYELKYSYHFAKLIKDNLRRGSVCWAAPTSCFVFVDEDGEAYNVFGLVKGYIPYLIPEKYCKKIVKEFSSTEVYAKDFHLTKKDIVKTIKSYCEKNDIQVNEDLEKLTEKYGYNY